MTINGIGVVKAKRWEAHDELLGVRNYQTCRCHCASNFVISKFVLKDAAGHSTYFGIYYIYPIYYEHRRANILISAITSNWKQIRSWRWKIRAQICLRWLFQIFDSLFLVGPSRSNLSFWIFTPVLRHANDETAKWWNPWTFLPYAQIYQLWNQTPHGPEPEVMTPFTFLTWSNSLETTSFHKKFREEKKTLKQLNT